MPSALWYEVYTPPDYNDRDVSYPALYLLHGRGDNERTWLERGDVKSIVDQLIGSRRLDPLVIVMPYGFIRREDQNVNVRTYRYPESNEWKQRLLEIIRDVETRYRIRRGREHQAIAGVSMGSEQALDLVLVDLTRFSRLGCFSPAFPRKQFQLEGDRFKTEEVATRWPKLVNYEQEPQLELCRLSWGSDEGDVIQTQYEPLRNELALRSVRVTRETFPGKHGWTNNTPWKACLRDFLGLLWNPTN